MEDFGTLKGGSDCQEHYHNSDRFPSRDTLLWLQSIEKITRVSVNYAVVSNDDIVVADAAITVTLPVASGGRRYTICMTASGSTTVVPSGTDTIGGDASLTLLNRNSKVTVKAVSGGWVVV